nr:alpha/beta hydrolase [Neoroseomonas alba]
MRRRRAALLGGALGLTAQEARAATEVTLQAADGVRVFGTHLAAEGRPRGTVLLFHMAGSNRGEYATIAPELAHRGFDSLAIDQRSGGPAWGRRNETVAALGHATDFAAALPDLDIAFTWAAARPGRGPVLIWGSSYSAALVFLLAARRPGVAAMLAFSPGEYLQGVSVRDAAARVTCPAFVTSSSDAPEIAAATQLVAALRGTPRRQYRPAIGQHGSQTLRSDRNPRGAAAGWEAVGAFLDEVTPPRES